MMTRATYIKLAAALHEERERQLTQLEQWGMDHAVKILMIALKEDNPRFSPNTFWDAYNGRK